MMVKKNSNDYPAQESDPRFPSAGYVGHYIQWGRVFKMDLTLDFRAGRFGGHGIDGIGPFVVNGTYDVDTGRVSFLKRYHGRHTVVYVGYAEAVGQGIWGTWTIGKVWDRDGWRIWPRRRGQTAVEHETVEDAAPVCAVPC